MGPALIFRKNLKVLMTRVGVSSQIWGTPLAQFLNIAISFYGASLYESDRLHSASAAN